MLENIYHLCLDSLRKTNPKEEFITPNYFMMSSILNYADIKYKTKFIGKEDKIKDNKEIKLFLIKEFENNQVPIEIINNFILDIDCTFLEMNNKDIFDYYRYILVDKYLHIYHFQGSLKITNNRFIKNRYHLKAVLTKITVDYNKFQYAVLTYK